LLFFSLSVVPFLDCNISSQPEALSTTTTNMDPPNAPPVPTPSPQTSSSVNPSALSGGLLAFNRSSLKPTETRITNRDGSQYIEKRGPEGKEVREFQGIVATPEYLNDATKGCSTIQPKSFDSSKSSWTTLVGGSAHNSGSSSSGEVRSLSFVTYNVWFADHMWQERAEALFKIIEQLRPDVACLQEVTPRFINLIQQQTWLRENYIISDKDGITTTPYGVIMLVSKKHCVQSVTLHLMPTNMGRRVLITELFVTLSSKQAADGQSSSAAGSSSDQRRHKIKVATIHLESLHNPQMRRAQLELILPLLNPMKPKSVDQGNDDEHSCSSFLMGDFNLCGSSEENLYLTESWPQFVDMWPAVHPDRPHVEGLTMPGESRIDRILVCSKVFKPKEIERIGIEPIPGTKQTPSDHYGLYGTVELY
jgi:endonuclease/exonuclease/phosphatase family metal-dependent hydrolase